MMYRKAIAVLLVLSVWCTDAHRCLQASPPPASPFPGDWDVPVTLMSRGDLLARGGALNALGKDKLMTITAQSKVDKNVEQLAATLDGDSDLYVDTVGDRLMFRCQSMIYLDNSTDNSTAAAAAAVAEGAASPALTRDQVFSLHSRPGAPKTIVLDFDGHTVQNTWWNTASRPTIQAKPYDKDNDPTSFSQAELQDIRDIWRTVAEDYAPFDVDVTTQDPGDAALTDSGIRAVIGGSSNDWYGSSAGGVAWVGSFGTNNPAFIWPALLGPYRTKYVADATSHEIGHTLGLLHDGNTVTSYYAGQGDWAPIMGVPYVKPIAQFDKGEYSGSNNDQDDFKVMSFFLAPLSQKYGNSVATATPIDDASLTMSGIISAQGQADFFTFKAKAGSAKITVDVAAQASGGFNIADLDTKVTLYDTSGRVIDTAKPPGATPEALGAQISARLPADGRYYVSVAGAGAGDPLDTGYSSYGSRGQYTLTAAYTPNGRNGDGGTVPSDGSVDCVGSWSAWGSCSKACSGGTQTRTYHITDPGKSTGKPCSASEGDTQSQVCNAQPCSGGSSTMRVQKITLTKQTTVSGRVKCTAKVTLKSPSGVVARASLTGTWTVSTSDQRNAHTTTASQDTDAQGRATFVTETFSPAAQSNTCTFQVVSALKSGFKFRSTANLRKALTWP